MYCKAHNSQADSRKSHGYEQKPGRRVGSSVGFSLAGTSYDGDRSGSPVFMVEDPLCESRTLQADRPGSVWGSGNGVLIPIGFC